MPLTPRARAFLKATPDFNTDPFQMTGMETAVERIRQAIRQRQAIAIYGDYDVDGVTATASVQTLQALGADVRGYIPNRFDEGYGLNKDALDLLKADGVKLVITVDCGIRSPDEALHAQTHGLDLIISDHHHPAGTCPPHWQSSTPNSMATPTQTRTWPVWALPTRSPRPCSAGDSHLRARNPARPGGPGHGCGPGPAGGRKPHVGPPRPAPDAHHHPSGTLALANVAESHDPRSTQAISASARLRSTPPAAFNCAGFARVAHHQ